MTLLIVLLWGLASIPVWRGWSTPGEPRETGRVRAVFSGVLRFVLIPAACLLFAFLPAAIVVPELPTPTGSFAVGVTDFSVRFDDRPEVLSEDPGDSREILVRAWYPAERRRGDEAEPYFTKAETQAFVETNSATIPGFGYLFSQAALARDALRTGRIRRRAGGRVSGSRLLAWLRALRVAEHSADGRAGEPRLHRVRPRSHLGRLDGLSRRPDGRPRTAHPRPPGQGGGSRLRAGDDRERHDAQPRQQTKPSAGRPWPPNGKRLAGTGTKAWAPA